MKEITGTGVALLTPFTQNKTIDFLALEKLVNYVIEGGVDYLVLLGTTAETATLSSAEKQQVIEAIIKYNNKRVPLVLGIGGNNTQEVISQIKNTNTQHFTAILSVSPYYNKPTQEGIYQHYKAIAEATNKPIILYNVPSRTGSNMEVCTTLRLANDCKNIVGIKEASPNFNQPMQLLRDKPKDFMVISGDDDYALPITLAGGSGVISVIGQGFPKEFSQMIRFGLDKKSTEAYELYFQLMESIYLIFKEGNPAGIKSMLSLKHICEAYVRLPLVEASEKLRNEMKVEVERLRAC
jgi:4-hydroxy-tetrahydrodipicolinate synthase